MHPCLASLFSLTCSPCASASVPESTFFHTNPHLLPASPKTNPSKSSITKYHSGLIVYLALSWPLSEIHLFLVFFSLFSPPLSTPLLSPCPSSPFPLFSLSWPWSKSATIFYILGWAVSEQGHPTSAMEQSLVKSFQFSWICFPSFLFELYILLSLRFSVMI